MIKIFIELINNFLSDGIYRTGLAGRLAKKDSAVLCSGLFAFLVSMFAGIRLSLRGGRPGQEPGWH